MTSKELFSLLNDYGLSQNESKVYIGLLRYGHSTIMELSNRIRMNRSTVHLAVKSLILKGLLSQTKYGDRRMIIPEAPEKLQLLLENEKMSIKRKEEGLAGLIDNIYGLVHAAKESTDFVVKYVEGREAVSSLYDTILESKEIRAYYNFQKLTKLLPENAERFYQAALNGTKIRDIIAGSPKEHLIKNYDMYKDVEAAIKFKILPDNIELKAMDYLIYDNKIALVYFESNLFKAIVISSSLLYENTKVLFDLLWEFLP